MKGFAKVVCVVLAYICIGCAVLSVPISVFFGLYEWAIQDVEFKVSAFNAFVLWIKLALCFIPGFIFYRIVLS